MVTYMVSHRLIDDIVLISVRGGCDDRCTMELEALLDRLIAEGYKRYVLDVAGLAFAESPGFRLLIRKVADIQELGGDLVVAGLSGRIERAFNLLKLGTLVPTTDDVRTAITGFREQQARVLRTGTNG